MADFKTHIATSSALGIAYGVSGHMLYQLPIETCVLAGGLCSVSGMLPDMDSDSGVPLRESMAFAAAVVPMLMLNRLQHLGLTHEWIVVAGAGMYALIRFGLSEVLRRFTVHRGMWHSLPAAAIAFLLAFLLCCNPRLEVRFFLAGGVFAGFMSHLILDEIWAMRFGMLGVRFKKSFGTALKMWGDNSWANFSTYAKLVFVGMLALGDPMFMERYGGYRDQIPQTARDWLNQNFQSGQGTLRR